MPRRPGHLTHTFHMPMPQKRRVTRKEATRFTGAPGVTGYPLPPRWRSDTGCRTPMQFPCSDAHDGVADRALRNAVSQ